MAENQTEITVEIPEANETESTDQIDDGISESTAVAAGAAIATADNAQEDAAEATETADEAAAMATIAVEETAQAQQNIDQLASAVQNLTMAIAALGADQIQTKEMITEIHGTVTAPPPVVKTEDEAPRSSHWLNRKIGK